VGDHGEQLAVIGYSIPLLLALARHAWEGDAGKRRRRVLTRSAPQRCRGTVPASGKTWARRTRRCCGLWLPSGGPMQRLSWAALPSKWAAAADPPGDVSGAA
jgi:hypothetical protein